MYLSTKAVFRNGKKYEVRIKSLDWNGKRYGLVVNGEIKERGDYERIENLFEKF